MTHGDHTEYTAAVARMIRAAGRRYADADPVDLVELVQLHDALDDALVTAVRAQHAQGQSWTDIGRALGVTRQAARQRFADLPSTPAVQLVHGEVELPLLD